MRDKIRLHKVVVRRIIPIAEGLHNPHYRWAVEPSRDDAGYRKRCNGGDRAHARSQRLNPKTRGQVVRITDGRLPKAPCGPCQESGDGQGHDFEEGETRWREREIRVSYQLQVNQDGPMP